MTALRRLWHIVLEESVLMWTGNAKMFNDCTVLYSVGGLQEVMAYRCGEGVDAAKRLFVYRRKFDLIIVDAVVFDYRFICRSISFIYFIKCK